MNSKKIIVVVLAGFVILSAFQCQRISERSLSTEEDKTVVYRLVDEAWNKGNVGIIDALLCPDYVLHIPSRQETVDREGYKQAIHMYRTAFPDVLFSIQETITEEDKVVIRWTITGTHKGPYMGVAPTDKRVTLTGISIRRFEEGKIAEEWVVSDMLGLMQQMGIIPAVGPGK